MGNGVLKVTAWQIASAHFQWQEKLCCTKFLINCIQSVLKYVEWNARQVQTILISKGQAIRIEFYICCLNSEHLFYTKWVLQHWINIYLIHPPITSVKIFPATFHPCTWDCLLMWLLIYLQWKFHQSGMKLLVLAYRRQHLLTNAMGNWCQITSPVQKWDWCYT